MTPWSKVLSTEDDHARLDAGWQRVSARRAGPRRMARRALLLAPVVVVATLLLLPVHDWLFPRPAVIVARAALAPIALLGGAALPAQWSPSVAEVVALDDGSHLELEAATTLRRGEGAPERVDLVLTSGRVTFDVKPHGPRAWVVDAGPVVVRVLGTRFTVARTGAAVTVTVERGRVEVTGPEGTTVLAAGQSWPAPSARETTNVARDRAAPEGATQRATEPRGRVEVSSVTPSAPVVLPSPAPATSSDAPAATRDEPVDAMIRADALRRAGRARDAIATLRELLDAGERRASLAAFTIGKIEAEDLHDAASAARSFERAVAIGLPPGLDEEGCARAVESYARAGDRSEAARAARRYETRFPAGRRLAQVKEWSRD